MSARTRTSHREYLRKLPLFATLSSGQLDAIDERATTLDLPPGFVIAREGDVSREMVLVVDGRLAVTRTGQHIATLGPGDAVGEQGLLAERPRNATVTVVEPSRVLHLDARAFRDVIEAVPEVAARLLPIVAGRAAAPSRPDDID